MITSETLGDAIDKFITERNSVTYQQTVLLWWKKQLGKKRLGELRKSDVVAARKKLQRETSQSGESDSVGHINCRVAALSAVLTACAEEWILLEVNPARIRSLPENKKRDRILTDGERDALLGAGISHDHPALYDGVSCYGIWSKGRGTAGCSFE